MSDLHGVIHNHHGGGLVGACKVARPLGDTAVYAPAGERPTCAECLKLGAIGWTPPQPPAAPEPQPGPAPAHEEPHP